MIGWSSYDSWKLATPPEYEWDEHVCETCGRDKCPWDDCRWCQEDEDDRLEAQADGTDKPLDEFDVEDCEWPMAVLNEVSGE